MPQSIYHLSICKQATNTRRLTPMDNIVTINSKWKICTCISLVSCLALLLCLNPKQNVVPLSDVQNAVPITAVTSPSQSPATSNVKFTKTTMMAEGMAINQTTVQCNIFEGKWVYKSMENPLYNASQCPFLSDQVSCRRNGRPDFKYEKWSWEAPNCKIPR